MGREQTGARKYLYLSFAILILFSIFGCGTLEKMRIKISGKEEAYQCLSEGRKLFAEGDYEGALWKNENVVSLSPFSPPADQAFLNMGMIHAHPGNPKKDYGKSVTYFKKVAEEYPGTLLAEESKIWIVMIQEHDKLSQVIERLGRRVEQLKKERENVGALKRQRLLAEGDYEGALRENEKIIFLSPPAPHRDLALFSIGMIYAHPGNSKKDYGKAVAFCQMLIKDHPKSPLVEEAKVLTGMLQENDKLNRTVGRLSVMVERLNLMVEESKKTIERLNQVIEESKKVDIQIEEKKREKVK